MPVKYNKTGRSRSQEKLGAVFFILPGSEWKEII